MAEMYGSLIFLLALDVAVCLTLFLNYRAIRDRFLLYGFAMLLAETFRQTLTIAYATAPDWWQLGALSTFANLACNLLFLVAVAEFTRRKVHRPWFVIPVLAQAAIVAYAVAGQPQMQTLWILGTTVTVAIHLATMAILLAARRTILPTALWLIGLSLVMVVLRVGMAYFVTRSDTVFGLLYFLDAIAILFVGGTLVVISMERLARRFAAARSEAEETQKLLAAILDTGYDAIVTCDKTEEITSWNAQAEATFGWKRAEAVGKPLAECIPGVQFHGESATRRLLTQVSTHTRDGNPIEIDVSAFTIETVRSPAVVLIVRDITDRLRAEAENRALENQMRHVQRLESLGVLAGGVAHDYNNILAAIMSFADLGWKDAADPQARAHFEDILDAARRGSELARQILTYAGRNEPHPRDFDLARTVQDMLPLLRTIVSKKTEIVTDFRDGNAVVCADEAQFGQVILNLVANASEAMEDTPGAIRIGAEIVTLDCADLAESLYGHELAEGTYVRLHVSDPGCGLDPNDIPRIFDPFYSTKLAGRGLGLATVAGTVHTHGGAVRVQSSPGAGTSVEIFLPPGNPNRLEPAALPARPMPATSEPVPEEHGAVLLVDDEEPLRRAVSMILRRAGFTVVQAGDGHEALDAVTAQTERFRLVILDCNMPGLSGPETLVEIRQKHGEIPVLMTSGNPLPPELLRTPRVSFIKKPYRADDLVARAHEIIARNTPEQPITVPQD